MTATAGTVSTYANGGTLTGMREDLQNMIYDISPTETPFLTMAGKTQARARYHEWQTDSLASAAANIQIEGDDATYTTATNTSRVGNYVQRAAKTVSVSDTAEAVDKAGRKSELARLLIKYGKELKRDMEFALVRNQASSVGGFATGRALASVESWIATNRQHSSASDTTGTTPGFSGGTVAAPTDGTQYTLSESVFTAGLGAAWTQGGDASLIMCGKFNKGKIDAFSGIATKYNQVNGNNPATIIGAADVYVSDYGNHKIMLNRYMRDRTVLQLDPDYWDVATLQPITKKELARTGAAQKYLLDVEFTLVAKNESSSAKVDDLTTS